MTKCAQIYSLFLRLAPPQAGSPRALRAQNPRKSPKRVRKEYPGAGPQKPRKSAPRSLKRVRKDSKSLVLDSFWTLLRPSPPDSFWTLSGILGPKDPGDPVWGGPIATLFTRMARTIRANSSSKVACNPGSVGEGVNLPKAQYHSFRNHYMLNSKTIKLCNCNSRKFL